MNKKKRFRSDRELSEMDERTRLGEIGYLGHDPELLLLDEITANLDAETEQHVLRALRRVSKNRTVLSISHRTSAEFDRSYSLRS